MYLDVKVKQPSIGGRYSFCHCILEITNFKNIKITNYGKH